MWTTAFCAYFLQKSKWESFFTISVSWKSVLNSSGLKVSQTVETDANDFKTREDDAHASKYFLHASSAIGDKVCARAFGVRVHLVSNCSGTCMYSFRRLLSCVLTIVFVWASLNGYSEFIGTLNWERTKFSAQGLRKLHIHFRSEWAPRIRGFKLRACTHVTFNCIDDSSRRSHLCSTVTRVWISSCK